MAAVENRRHTGGLLMGTAAEVLNDITGSGAVELVFDVTRKVYGFQVEIEIGDEAEAGASDVRS
ncbi:hypothetical protein B0J13DRAFT_565533 [Dactylonectria estremocensis]|uniref:Uncharacterized protein n=1 Tax=Dactylonectria estremocensis TaxID=1079267 RepID=A0A9P9IPD5_9HYPO|nr:hypothetical protein B0J13DRAFT_565533 [Dactylonectria estremocensis]